MLNKNYHNQYRTEYAPSSNGRLIVGGSAKGSIFPDCCKIIIAILVLCSALNIYAAQPGEIPAKEKQSQPVKEAGTKQAQQAANEGRKKEKKKPRGVFIPSDKVSSDIPVSFPADI